LRRLLLALHQIDDTQRGLDAEMVGYHHRLKARGLGEDVKLDGHNLLPSDSVEIGTIEVRNCVI
jgi:hypothetical protein